MNTLEKKIKAIYFTDPIFPTPPASFLYMNQNCQRRRKRTEYRNYQFGSRSTQKVTNEQMCQVNGNECTDDPTAAPTHLCWIVFSKQGKQVALEAEPCLSVSSLRGDMENPHSPLKSILRMSLGHRISIAEFIVSLTNGISSHME